MSLPELSIKKPITILMIVVALFFIGYLSLNALNIDLFPNIDFPVAFIQAVYPGVDPAEMENIVTIPIEDEISTVSNIDKIDSYSVEGFSQIVVQFKWGQDIDFGAIDLREKTDIAKRELPRDIENVTVSKFDINSQPVMSISVSGGTNLVDLRTIVDEEVKPAIERVEGVGAAEVSGGLEREIHVNVNPDLLEELGIPIGDIVKALSSDNMNVPSGDLTDGQFKYLIRTEGEVEDVREIGNIPVKQIGPAIIKISDVAQVVDTYKDITSIGRMNGKPSVNISIKKESGANPVEVSDGVQAALKDLKKNRFKDLEFAIGRDGSDFIRDSINMVKSNALTGALLATIVLFLFLKNFRSTIIIAIAIPVSIIATFSMMYLKEGMTLNLMTLGGLALGIGMLLDNSIVVLENVYRHFVENPNKDNEVNSKEGSEEVSMPVLASTLTTIAVFAPIGFVPDVVGEIFFNLSLSIVFALISSYFVAFTVIPALSARFLKVGSNEKESKEPLFGKIKEIYSKFLYWIISSKKRLGIYFVSVIACFFISILLFPPSEFFPKMDRGMFTIDVKLAEGTTIEKVDKVCKSIEKQLGEIKEVQKVVTSISLGSANFLITMSPVDERNITTEYAMNVMREKVKEIPNIKEISFSEPKMGPGGGKPIQINVYGEEFDKIEFYCKEIYNKIKDVDGLKDLTDGVNRGRPEVKIHINRDKIRDLGFNLSEIAMAVRTSVYGSIASKFKEFNKEFDIRVKLEDKYTDSVKKLQNLRIFHKGKVFVLSDVADLDLSYGYTSIERKDKRRKLTVESDLSGRPMGAIIKEIMPKLKEINFEPGYSAEFGGDEEDRKKAFINLGIALIAAIFLVYMIMASQFESLVEPFIIMFTIPLSVIGVVLFLNIFNFSFSVTAIIGIIMLAGIVVNNGILLVDYINLLRKSGTGSMNDAIISAGLIRIRPIFMTASTTILGMLPLALGIGAGSDFYQPLAITVVGGLVFSTFLTLTFIPVTYIIVEGIREYFKNFFNRVFKKARV